jgi:hypothetical protein
MQMERLNEMTVGEVLKALSRYRPFLLTIVGVALIAVVLPGARQDDDTVATGITGSGTQVQTGPRDAGTSADATGGTAATGATGGTRASGTRATASGGATSAAGTGELTGGAPPPAALASSSDPLDAPDCDRATGRIMIPSNLAPNCVPLWPAGADNGGATSRGVTGSEIKILIYTAQDNAQADAVLADAGFEDDTDEQEDDANRERVIEAFEAHYETYGRHVVFERLYATGEADDDAAARADAIDAADRGAFAVIGGTSGTNAFTDELAARGVLCFGGCAVSQPVENYLRWAPYVWSTLMASTQGYVHRTAMACRLKGQPAEWAGSPDLALQERKLGLLYYETADGAYGLGADFFEQELAARCGWHLTDRMAYVLDLSRSAEDARIMIARMKEKGINTVVFAGDPLTPIFVTKEATNQNYFPEWLVTGSALTDTTFFARTYAQEQWSQAYGVSFLVARVEPAYTAGEPNLVEWHFGEELTSYPSIIDLGQFFIGLHLTGPNLNPHTFRDGMFSYAPTGGFLTDYAVSWGRGVWPWDDYLALDDTTELWWDATARGTDEQEIDGVGMYRYVDGGKRYMPNEWPTTKPKAFVTDGTVTLYPERPEADRPPAYEHTDHHHRGPQG